MAAETLVMARKKPEKRSVEPAKIDAQVMRDARVVAALTGEGLSEYLSRLLRPLVARDKAAAVTKEAADLNRKPKN